MSRQTRIDLLRQIEERRGSKVIAYVTGDRPPIMAQIGEDAVRPLYEHLLALPPGSPRLPRLDLFLYSRGGDVGVPWRIVSMMREFADEVCILIPYKAHSAATMIALGSDRIVMGRKAELGPIDPSLVKAPGGEVAGPLQISTEDVSSYLAFMRERAGITDQTAMAQLVSQLSNQVTPVTLGSVQRQYSHIRLVARKLLGSRNEKTDEERVAAIIDSLTEKLYSHGHAIGRKEAADLGLLVEEPDADLEGVMWSLHTEFEAFLELNDPLDPEEVLDTQNADQYTLGDTPLALIESVQRLDVFEGSIEVQRVRQVPPNPQISLNLQLALPANINVSQLPAQTQQLLQQLVGQASQMVGPLVQQEIARQSPMTGVNVRVRGGRWRDRSGQADADQTAQS